MINIADLSDAELEAIAGGDHEGLAAAAAQRMGVRPDLAVRVMRRESAGKPDAVSPKGARGLMQLMPDTAKELGVDPDDPVQNVLGGVTYLKRQLDDFGDERLALAAYNAGPGRVREANGVPNIRETQDYVGAILGDGGARDLSAMSDEELARIAGEDMTEVARSQSGGVTIEAPSRLVGQTAPRPIPRKAEPGVPARREGPTIAQDVVSGVTQPFRNLGETVMSEYRRKTADVSIPRNPLDAAKRSLDDMLGTAAMVGDTLGLMSAPIQAVVRPVSRAINLNTPDMYEGPRLSLEGGVPRLSAPRKLEGDERQAAVEQGINMALSAARPAATRVPAPPKAPTLEELRVASDKAWDAVDASGYRFPKKDVQALAKDVRAIVADADPDLYPEAAKVAAKIERMAGRGELTPAKANRLRSQIGEKLLGPKSTEVSVGTDIKARIDAFIDAAADPALASAREIYTRLKKVEEFTKRADSAELRAASTYAGGNKANATRQNFRPLIDPKSGQRMRNLTKAEQAALRGVVKGTPGQNAARLAGKVLDPRGLLGATVQMMMGVPSGGTSAFTMIPGMLASEASNAMTAKNVQRLIDLAARGGNVPKRGIPIPIAPTGAIARDIGEGVVLAPLVRIPRNEQRATPRKAAARSGR